jgi:pimeloyl-ACP methyl ester carboxylesterase
VAIEGTIHMAEERLTLMLLHGTWARDAPWTRPDGPLVAALRKAFPNLKGFDRIAWTGKNTFKARLEGADRLIESLSVLPDNERAVLCGHSHAGGAICYALTKRPELARKVKAAIFLSTPFFLFRLSPSWRVISDASNVPTVFIGIWTSLSVMALLLSALARILFDRFGEAGRWIAWAMIIALFLVSVECLLRILVILNRVRTSSQLDLLKDARERRRLITCELPLNVQALFVRVSGDEASSALIFAQGFSWSFIAMNNVFSRIFGTVLRPLRVTRLRHPVLTRIIFAIVCALVVNYVVSMERFITLRRSQPIPSLFEGLSLFESLYVTFFEIIGDSWITGGALAVFGVAIVVYSICLWLTFLTAIIFQTANWAIALSFGRLPYGVVGVIQPAIEVVPPGTWSVCHMPWRSYGGRGLRHSSPYMDPKIIEKIVSWLHNLKT